MSYDEIPYESSPFPETHPNFLATVARLFGVDAAPPDQCRVLELGCASGGNLIPMAFRLPDAHFVGIELSATQVADGQRLIAQAELPNIELHQGDILQFDTEGEGFDYIICHGVYSWAPEAVRERILAICRGRLNENGVAYISYNTLPGWHMRGMLREMLLHHTRELESPQERLAGAHELLGFLDGSLEGSDALHGRYLRMEIDRIRGNHPSYLYHEYLEEINQPFLFSRFVEDAARHDLRYLCDTELHSMFASPLGETADQMLGSIEDPIQRWQYTDFLTNRNFRQSLLCRSESRVARDPDLERFNGYAFHSDLKPPKKLDLRRVKAAPFTSATGERVQVAHPLTKAALAHLDRVFPDSLSFEDLVSVAQRQVTASGGGAAAAQLDHLTSELFSLFAHQAIGAAPSPHTVFHQIEERPRANRLARVQADAGIGHAAGFHHTTVGLDPFSTVLLQQLDGTRDRTELVRELARRFEEDSTLSALAGNQTGEKLRQMISANTTRMLELFARQGLLEPGTAA
ncbi:methyltransferase regulatory domain-containing protein [Thiohalomonas denitrificans]|uniref:Regulatory domain of a methyltransferase-containing protein n=1 Tax=Thiohalomonas denitrificans TaxID=415747 RepID=A0A1G5QLL2_9GAMM|nr:class I SAM-dependent methyltransferase [Thiohalomonas denitrificans]SCZ62724.1 regulatory domain of a methyltransferase-containing protein [Thiohalomonas denitrificans]